MRVTLLQTDIIWKSPSENRGRLNSLLSGLAPTDLIVLPEMFSTGFVTEPEGVAEKSPAESLLWMKSQSQRLNVAIAGSLSIEEKGHYYNRFYFVKPDGSFTSYDKRHLFTYGGEDKHYTAGQNRVIVTYKGIRFLLLICYDLRFPVWARNRKDYDAIIIVASWPDCRRYAWDTLLRARAIENQCYVLAVNREGDDPQNHYSGGTYIIDPSGMVLAEAQRGQLTLEIEPKQPAFSSLDDADNFTVI